MSLDFRVLDLFFSLVYESFDLSCNLSQFVIQSLLKFGTIITEREDYREPREVIYLKMSD